MSQIKTGLQIVDLQANDLFMFVSLEAWSTEIRLFAYVDDLYDFIILKHCCPVKVPGDYYKV